MLFPFVLTLFINDLPVTEALFRVARADCCVMAIMVLMQRFNPTDDFIEMSSVDLDPRMFGKCL